jgi:methyl-accepting chemotaxis protein
MIISDISLTKKLSLSFGIVFLMLSSLLFFNNSTINFSQNNFNKLLHNEISIESIADGVNISLLQLRQREKDFLLRNNLKHVELHQQEWYGFRNEIELLQEVAYKNPHLAISEHIKVLFESSEKYELNFTRLVRVKEKIGLNSRTGLQGDFTQAAHLLSSALAEYDITNLYQQYLLLRRWEKDFVRTQDDKYMQRLSATLLKYESMLSISTLQENSKQIQQQALAGYKQALSYYFSLQNNREKFIAYEQLRLSAHKMEASILAFFIENGPALALQIRRNEKNYLLTADERYATATNESILALKKQINDSKIAYEHSDKLLALLNTYVSAFNDLITENKLLYTHTQALRNAAHKIEPLLYVIKDLLEKSQQNALNHTLNSINNRQSISITIGLLILLTGLFVIIVLSRSISQPINAMKDVVTNIVKGDLSLRFENNRGDEIGKLATSINAMVERLNEIANQADLIAQGDFSVEISPQSRTDKLAISLNEMKNKISYRTRLMQESEGALQAANNTLVQQNELKNQLSKMTEFDNESNYLETLCDKTISSLAKLTGAGHGALYVASEKEDKLKDCLTLTGSYALKKNHISQVVPIGAGLVGQCAKEKTTIMVTEVPGDYIYINSALGQQLPLNIILTPVMFEQKLIAVIELASFTPFTQEQQEMLQQVTEYIGFIINQQKIKKLLKDLQARA